MYASPADWPASLTLELADAELAGVERQGTVAVVRLASAPVHWPVPTQRQPQPGWVWPLRLVFTGLQDWQWEALQPGRLAAAQLTRDGQDLTLTLPSHSSGHLTLTLVGARGGRLQLQATALHIDGDGAQLRESLAC